MSLTSIISGAVEGLVKPITGLLGRRQERLAAREAVRGKIAVAAQEDEQEMLLTDAEWEVVSQGMSDKSWKDEFLTIVITAPFSLFIFGGILAAFGMPEVLEGTAIGITALVNAGVDVGFLLQAVVLAGIGLKIWRA